jgi:hypothetical protein
VCDPTARPFHPHTLDTTPTHTIPHSRAPGRLRRLCPLPRDRVLRNATPRAPASSRIAILLSHPSTPTQYTPRVSHHAPPSPPEAIHLRGEPMHARSKMPPSSATGHHADTNAVYYALSRAARGRLGCLAGMRKRTRARKRTMPRFCTDRFQIVKYLHSPASSTLFRPAQCSYFGSDEGTVWIDSNFDVHSST